MRSVTANRKDYLDLLLSADPSEDVIDRYLDAPGSEMFVWENPEGEIIGEVVVDRLGEIKNVAVGESWQGKGVGRKMLDDVCRHYRGRFGKLTVGTDRTGTGFYERCGFRYSHTVEGFFTENYPEPILQEDGVQSVDMIYLEKEL